MALNYSDDFWNEPTTGGGSDQDKKNGLFCPNCGSTEIEHHEASGASICTNCAIVVEENAIVSSVEFDQNDAGVSSMRGNVVSANSSRAYTGGGGGGGRYGFSRDSRETTLANGRRRIQDVASRLRLPRLFVDAAHTFFTVAVEKNFVQGRRTIHVVAACLYIACRQEKSQHMLIDFSDALQVNVYTLGTTFLKFRRLLGLPLEIIDPALYVYRFAAHLDLEDKANAVALTALRLVGRMKRDWIVSGRRPAGICAAALLIASRAHGFNKKNQDVTRILRVCGMTVNNRVREFEATPSARLTLEQFQTMDVATESDPPIYTKNKLEEARALAIQENNVELLTSGKLDTPSDDAKAAARWRQIRPASEKQRQLEQMYTTIEQELRTNQTTTLPPTTTNSDQDNINDSTSHHPQQPQDVKSNETNAAADKIESSVGTKRKGRSKRKSNSKNNDNHDHQSEVQIVPQNPGQLTTVSNIRYPKRNGRALVLPFQATEEELRKSTQPAVDQLNMERWKQEMPEFHLEEIQDLFRSEEEVKQKEAIFNKMNQDYLHQQEKKEKERLTQEAAKKEEEKEDAALEEERARYHLKSRFKRKLQEEGADATSIEAALLATVSSRKISRKINYDAMSAIFDDNGTFSTDQLEDEEPKKFIEDQFEMV